MIRRAEAQGSGESLAGPLIDVLSGVLLTGGCVGLDRKI